MSDTNLIVSNAISAIANIILLAGLPFLGYYLYQSIRKKRGIVEVAAMTGLQIGDARYIGYSLAVSLFAIAAFVLWPPSLESSTREGSAFQQFVGLGTGWESISLALIYGVAKTGFPEEFLFRGLIAGSLARRLSLVWANVVQALIFLIPHMLFLKTTSDASVVLPIIFAGSLFVGWVRFRSESIVGPWLVHATVNTVMCISVAART